jgi:hypothetical protein
VAETITPDLVDDPTTEPPRPGRSLPRPITTTALLVAGLALLVAPFLYWQLDLRGWSVLGAADSLRTDGERVGVALAVPVGLFGLVLAARPFVFLRRLVLLLAALATAFLLHTAIAPAHDGESAPGIGFGLAVFGYPLILLAALALELPDTGRRRGRVVALLTVAVLSAVVGTGATWFATARIAGTDGAGLATASAEAAPGTVLWHRATGGPAAPVAAAANGLVVLRTDTGAVTAIDADTGAQRWSYHRAGAAVGPTAVSQDGRTALAVYPVRGRDLVVALDTANGQVRWQQWSPAEVAEVLPTPGGVLTTYPDGRHLAGGRVVDTDPTTGAVRWTAPAGHCWTLHTVTWVAGTTVQLRCTGGGDDIRVTAVGLGDTGAVRWQTPLGRMTSALGTLLHPAGDVAALELLDPAHVALDPTTGRAIPLPATEEPLTGTADTLLDDDVGAQGSVPKPVLRSTTTGRTRPIDLAGASLSGEAAVIQGDQAYLLVDDATGYRLARVDLRTGAIDGQWPVPTALLIPGTPGTRSLVVAGHTVVISNPSELSAAPDTFTATALAVRVS